MNQEHEVRWWTKEFGCTREQLQKAVQAVGVSADKVRDYLRTRAHFTDVVGPSYRPLTGTTKASILGSRD